jgi:hypothetical protein
MGNNYKGREGQTQRAVVLQGEEKGFVVYHIFDSAELCGYIRCRYGVTVFNSSL